MLVTASPLVRQYLIPIKKYWGHFNTISRIIGGDSFAATKSLFQIILFGRWTPPVCWLFYFPSSPSPSSSISLLSHPSLLPSTPRHQPRLPSPASCTSPSSHSWMPSTLIAVDAPTSGEPNLGKQQMSLSLTLIPVVDSVAQDVAVTQLRSD